MRVAAVQLNATEDTDRNLETADRLVREAGATWSGVITPVVAGPTPAPQPEDISIGVIRRATPPRRVSVLASALRGPSRANMAASV